MKRRTYQYIVLGAASLVAAPAHGQEPSLFQISGDWIPNSGVIVSDDLEQIAPAPDIDARVATFSANFNVPIRLTDRSLLMPGASYELLSIRQTDARVGIPTERELHSVSVSLLFSYRLTQRWGLMVRVAPALTGDFAELDGDHFRLAGAAIASYTFSSDFTLGAGVVAGWQFGQPLPLPAIIARWQIADTVRFDGFLPLRIALVWRPHDRIELDLSASVRGQSYALTSQRVQGQWPCRPRPVDDPNTTAVDESEADPERCLSSLAYSQVEIGPTVGVRLWSSLWLSIQAGLPVVRRYEFLNEDNETPDIGDLGLDPSIMVRAQLTLRIPNS